MVHTLADHGLPSSDAGVAQPGGVTTPRRVVGFARAGHPGPGGVAYTDQQNAVDWFSTVVQRQGVQAADNAGLDARSGPVSGVDAYQQLLATNPSEAALQDFLSPPPANYGSGSR